MTHPNPYNYNLPVMPRMFFGRTSNVQALVHQLTTGQGNSILLVGGRRMGKTSLLEALKRVLQAKAKKPSRGLIPLPVLVDLMGEGNNSLSAFFRMICERSKTAVEEALSQDLNTVCDCDDDDHLLQPFQMALQTWARITLGQYGCRLRLILLLDEGEEIFDRTWSAELQRTLRALLTGEQTRDLLKVVIAGSHRLLAQAKPRSSPLNILTAHKLEVFNMQATRELITKPTNGGLTEETIQTIVSQTGGHAFLVQYIMYHLWERGIESVSPGTVQQIVAIFHKDRNDFRDWADNLGTSGLQVYNLLVRTNTSLTESTFVQNLNLSSLDIADALDALCYHGLVVADPNREVYSIAGQMFRDWFAAYKGSIRDI